MAGREEYGKRYRITIAVYSSSSPSTARRANVTRMRMALNKSVVGVMSSASIGSSVVVTGAAEAPGGLVAAAGGLAAAAAAAAGGGDGDEAAVGAAGAAAAAGAGDGLFLPSLMVLFLFWPNPAWACSCFVSRGREDFDAI